eukprot:TRINITY_DN4402_c0_g1_i2.p2 TRINITY_DN4402_c0_g1~~TRINITY_DN4402_c0_g1_i2.p2  ORF type:complete len:201 (-),score=16.04 TRINITY_DN4402_c0_g1_i2:12-614(-)
MGIWSSKPKEPADGDAPVAEAPKGLNLDDHVMLKRHLDEVATDIIISRGYDEDHRLGNLKMAVCAFACAVACAAQFYPRKFPDNRALLLACIAIYIALNVLLQLIVTFKEKNYFLFTYPQSGMFAQTGLALSSRMDRACDIYHLRIESADPSSASAHRPVELSKSITKWYTSDGLLAEDLFLEDVQRLVEQYEDDQRKTK